MSSDRIRLPTGATTIVRAPIARGKSHASSGAAWDSLPELNRGQHDLNGNDQQDLMGGAHHSARGSGPLPWRDAVIATSSSAPVAAASSSSRRSLVISSMPSSKAVSIVGGGDAGGGGAGGESGGANGSSVSGGAASIGTGMYRRNGVASAPIVSPTPAVAGGAGFADSSEPNSRRLPAIHSISRSAATSVSGVGNGGPAPAITPASLKGPSRRLLTLPSIHGASADTTGTASSAVATTVTSASGAEAGGSGSGPSNAINTSHREHGQPIIVSFAPSRPSSSKRSMPRLFARPPARVVSLGDGGGGSSAENEDASTDASGSTAKEGSHGHSTDPGALGAGLFRGIRRLLGKDSSLDPGAAVRAVKGGGSPATADGSASGSDNTLQTDDLSRSVAGGPRPNVSVTKLACEHAREQERVNRARSALFGSDVRMASRGARASNDGSRTLISACPSQRVLETHDSRALHAGKSFTQRTLEDPKNPVFKSAKQLAAVQEKLSYMEDPDWRAKAAEIVTMERPILMAEGWKV